MSFLHAALHAPPALPPFQAPGLDLEAFTLPPPQDDVLAQGWMRPQSRAVPHAPFPLMRAILSMDDVGERHMLLPSGGRVNIHPGLVAVVAGMARCKSCGTRATLAVELPDPKGRNSALWFVAVSEGGSWLPMTADHVVPESRGGATHAENLRCLCRACNMRKADRMEAGLKAERRYHTTDVLTSLVRDNPPGSVGRPAYRRMLKDRAGNVATAFLPTGDEWMEPWQMEQVRRTLQKSYGLRLTMRKGQGKMFPSLPPRAPQPPRAVQDP